MHNVIGFRNVDFTTQEGNRIQGVNLFLTYDDDHVIGQAAEKMFISSQKLSNIGYVPCVGDKIQVFYNRYGKPDNIQLIKGK